MSRKPVYNAGERTATVYGRNPVVIRKLDTLVADYPDIYSRTTQGARSLVDECYAPTGAVAETGQGR